MVHIRLGLLALPALVHMSLGCDTPRSCQKYDLACHISVTVLFFPFLYGVPSIRRGRRGKRYREGRLSYAGGHIQTNMSPSPEQLQPRSQSTFKFECKGPRAHEASGGGLLAKSRFALRNVVPSFVLDFWIGRRCQAVRQLTNSPVESSAISSPHRLQPNRRVIAAGFRQGH